MENIFSLITSHVYTANHNTAADFSLALADSFIILGDAAGKWRFQSNVPSGFFVFSGSKTSSDTSYALFHKVFKVRSGTNPKCSPRSS